nr:hypothetical protein [Tanacetum cinerariifolium]
MKTKDTLSSCSNSKEQQMQQIQEKAKESCMVSFQKLHSHLKLLSKNNLKGTRTESGFKRAFATLFGQDVGTFTGTMFLNMDQLEKQLDKEEFQVIGSMAAFKVLDTQFQMFLMSHIYLDDEYVVMTRNYFLQYTQLEILEFCDTLIQHIESVKKSIDERALHKREYDTRVNERQMQTTQEKVDTSKALDASLVDTENKGKESKEQDTSSSSGNDAHADNAYIRPIYNEEPMVYVQMTIEINVFATGQQHTEQPEFNNEGEVDQNAKQCHDKCPLPAKLTNNHITELSNQSLESDNICLKKTVAQFQKYFSKLEAHCLNLELQLQNNVLKSGQQIQFLNEKSNEAKVKHDIHVIETINIELEHNVAKLLKENETLKRHYKELSDSIKTMRAKTIEHINSLIAQNVEFKAQLQEKGFTIAAIQNDLRKLTENSMNTNHYTLFALERESAVVKSHHVIASSESRNSSKNMPRFSSNDMVHNHYLEEANKKTQERGRNSRPSKCVFKANHDSCVTKFLNEDNSRAKVSSNKTTNRNKPVEQTSVARKPERRIPKGHRFSIKKTFVVHEKTMTPRSCIRWKSMGKIFKSVGLRWVPTGKLFTSSTTKVDSEPINGSVDDINNQYECEQTLDVGACTVSLNAGTSFNPKKKGLRVWLLKRLISQKPGLQGIFI